MAKRRIERFEEEEDVIRVFDNRALFMVCTPIAIQPLVLSEEEGSPINSVYAMVHDAQLYGITVPVINKFSEATEGYTGRIAELLPDTFGPVPQGNGVHMSIMDAVEGAGDVG